MNVQHLRASAMIAVACACFTATAHGMARDSLRESLERMLGDEASRNLPAATRPDCSNAREPILVRLCDDIRRSPLSNPDPVSESFVRMLLHTPSPHVPPIPASIGADPLVEAMVEPLRSWLTGRHEDPAGTIARSARAPH